MPDLIDAVVSDGPGFDFSFDTTSKSSVMSAAVDVLGRPGLCVLVGAGFEPLTLMPSSIAGKSVTYAYMGHSNPKVFIPELIELWQRGRFPYDRLIESFAFEAIEAAEASALNGEVVKPVLLMTAQ